MVTINRPMGITVTIRDRENNKSKSLTVYGASLNEVYDKLTRIFKE